MVLLCGGLGILRIETHAIIKVSHQASVVDNDCVMAHIVAFHRELRCIVQHVQNVPRFRVWRINPADTGVAG